MKKSLLVRLAILIVTISTMTGCCWSIGGGSSGEPGPPGPAGPAGPPGPPGQPGQPAPPTK